MAACGADMPIGTDQISVPVAVDDSSVTRKMRPSDGIAVAPRKSSFGAIGKVA